MNSEKVSKERILPTHKYENFYSKGKDLLWIIYLLMRDKK